MISFAELLALMALALGGWFWLDSIRIREIGMQAARTACGREGVQLLDDTVATRSLRFARDEGGRLCLQRVYEFEYSRTGNDRVRGSVIVRGRNVVLLDVSGSAKPTFTVH